LFSSFLISRFTVPEFTLQGQPVTVNNGYVAASDVDTKGGHDTQLTFTHHNPGVVPFAVSTTGLVTVDLSDVSNTGDINFESPQKVRNLIVSVEDSGWGSTPPVPLPAAASVTITVTITDENDPPVIAPVWEWTGNAATDTILIFPEDCVGSGTSAAGNSMPSCSKQLTQSDPDDTTAGDYDTPNYNSKNDGWSLDSDCNGKFEISSVGVLQMTAAIDYEDAVAASNGNDPIHCTITARVVDRSGAADTMVVAVRIADVNEAPTAVNLIPKNGGPAAMTSNRDCWTYENASINTVACALTSTDPDIRASPAAQTHTYSKSSGTGTALYDVYNNPATVGLFGGTNPAPGIALGSSIILISSLDFETANSHTLAITVSCFVAVVLLQLFCCSIANGGI